MFRKALQAACSIDDAYNLWFFAGAVDSNRNELTHIHTCVVYVLQNDLLGGMKSVTVMQATSQTTVDEQER